jgi:hypothetical protein
MQGSLVINNSSGAVKRYKYIAGTMLLAEHRQPVLISRDLAEIGVKILFMLFLQIKIIKAGVKMEHMLLRCEFSIYPMECEFL